ncbi:MAG: TIGR00159 family protein [Ignavibacteria bacterium]|jgi:diadenylate cyclase|nr:TIGR00159 family protein [Ignavibacteria bacterium]
MIELFRIGFLQITLIDVLDIGIVTILFFALYSVLRDTIAVRILLGFILMLIVSFITQSLNLKALNWILRAIADIWLIAFIILFQPEIRRVLLMITRTKLFRVIVKRNLSQTLDHIVEAVKELSDRHVGALLVFPRSQNIKMTIDTGIPIQALVSSELLLSVFNPKSPLHDGAVIIENDMITAAKCVLPLSTMSRNDLGNLGTRHRAALGLSEQSDAVIVVVSEETGAISLAREGHLTQQIGIKTFPTLLQKYLSSGTIADTE